LPINWGISPFINEYYPGLMEYYYNTSTDQDVLVSSISGYGYYGLKHSAHARELAEREARSAGRTATSRSAASMPCTACSMRPTGCWIRRPTNGSCGAAAGVILFESAQRNRLWKTSAGQPLIGADWSLFYWKYRIPGSGKEQLRAVAERIKELAGAPGRPSFVPVYGGSPSDFIEIASHLDPARFKVVGLDEMVEAARQAMAVSGHTLAPVMHPVSVPKRRFEGRCIDARYGASSWGDAVEIDLGAFGVGRMKASLRFGWDEQYLYVHVAEKSPPARPCESRHQAGYAAGEFDLADGIALWFDYNLDGTRERGDHTLWLGFTSRRRHDLWCNMINDQVLTNVKPEIQIVTSSHMGLRSVMASIPWNELQAWLDPVHQPEEGLASVVLPGYTLACQPMLIEGLGGRAFLNGRSNRRENATAAALQDQRQAASLPMPDGFDAASLRIRLAPP
jgi:hypothetical protein